MTPKVKGGPPSSKEMHPSTLPCVSLTFRYERRRPRQPIITPIMIHDYISMKNFMYSLPEPLDSHYELVFYEVDPEREKPKSGREVIDGKNNRR